MRTLSTERVRTSMEVTQPRVAGIQTHVHWTLKRLLPLEPDRPTEGANVQAAIRAVLAPGEGGF